MKKITLLAALLLSMTGFSQEDRVFPVVSLNLGDFFQFRPDLAASAGSFSDYAWDGVPTVIFDNENKAISLEIEDFDPTNAAVGETIEVKFFRNGFGTEPLAWNADNETILATLTADDFTDGIAKVDVIVPDGTLPVAETEGYVAGYNYILQISGLNPQDDQNFVNYVVGISEQILSVDSLTKGALSSFTYDADSDEITLDVSSDYSVYNLAGSVVAEGSSSVISLAGLVDGVYIVATKQGTSKVVKY